VIPVGIMTSIIGHLSSFTSFWEADMLKVQGVEVRFNGFWALKSVTPEVGQGKVLSIVGPNGTGKTTFFKVMDMLIRPKVGSVYLNGRKLHPLGAARSQNRSAMSLKGWGFRKSRSSSWRGGSPL